MYLDKWRKMIPAEPKPKVGHIRWKSSRSIRAFRRDVLKGICLRPVDAFGHLVRWRRRGADRNAS
jgi:hypothetical protein